MQCNTVQEKKIKSKKKRNLCGCPASSLFLWLSLAFSFSLVDGWGHNKCGRHEGMAIGSVCPPVRVSARPPVRLSVCLDKHKQQLRSNNGQSCISAVTVFRTGNAFDACLKYWARKSLAFSWIPDCPNTNTSLQWPPDLCCSCSGSCCLPLLRSTARWQYGFRFWSQKLRILRSASPAPAPAPIFISFERTFNVRRLHGAWPSAMGENDS